jgi:small-conductance mechanosensitive channel
VNVPVTVGPNDSLDDVRTALLSTTRNDERIVADPAPTVVVTSVDGGKTGLSLRFWVRDESIERQAYHEYLEKAKRTLDTLNEDHGTAGNGKSKTAAA